MEIDEFKRYIMVVLLLVLLFMASPSTADIISLNLRSSRRHTILFSNFGFSHSGHVSLQISSVSVTSTLSQPDPSRIGFFLLPHELLNDYRFDNQQNPNLCVLDNEYISVLFTFQDVSNSSFNRSYPVSSPDMYSLYFANCNRRSFVTMDVRLELYNTYNSNTNKDYLSAGLTHLPSFYLVVSIFYLCFLGFWIFVCVKNHQEFHTIHFLMGVLLVATFGYFICGAADQHDLKVTGTRHGWDVWFYTFQLIRFVLLYTLIELIGMGFSLWNPILQGKETLVLMIVILLQVLANVASISADATGAYNENQFDLQSESAVVDFVCGFVIFVPFAWSCFLLRKTCESDENSVQNLEKLGSFVLVLILYVVFTRIGVPTLATFVVYKAPMVIHAAEETCNLVLCMVMFDIFRPCLRGKRQPWYARLYISIGHLNNRF